MKKLKFLIGLLLLIPLLNGCSSDIDLFKVNQDKQYVVFGFLNSTDPIQQIKVRLTSVTDASVNDIFSDSTEFSASPDLQVSIQEWFKGYYATYLLDRVIYPKDPGSFSLTRNEVYETRFTPDINMEYKLIISNPENGDRVESKIVPVPQPKLGAPTWSWIRYSFSTPGDPFNIRFYEVPRVHIYLVGFTIRYVDIMESGDTVFRSASWSFPPRYVDDPPEYSPTKNNLGRENNQHVTKSYAYRIFEQIIPDCSGLNYRQLICFNISVWGGDQNIRNYIELGIKFNDNRKQFFTNISNGIGFFGASSHSDCAGILPDRAFMDSLPLYDKTAGLKFRPELFPIDHLPAAPPVDLKKLIREVRYED